MSWRPADFVVAALTLTVCFIMGMTSLMPLLEFVPVDPEKQKLLAGVIGSMLSIVSLYVGAKIQEKVDGNK